MVVVMVLVMLVVVFLVDVFVSCFYLVFDDFFKYFGNEIVLQEMFIVDLLMDSYIDSEVELELCKVEEKVLFVKVEWLVMLDLVMLQCQGCEMQVICLFDGQVQVQMCILDISDQQIYIFVQKLCW